MHGALGSLDAARCHAERDGASLKHAPLKPMNTPATVTLVPTAWLTTSATWMVPEGAPAAARKSVAATPFAGGLVDSAACAFAVAAPAPGLGEVEVDPVALCCAVVQAMHSDAMPNIDHLTLFLFGIFLYDFDGGGVPQVGVLEIEHPLDVVFGDGRRQFPGQVHRHFDEFAIFDFGA